MAIKKISEMDKLSIKILAAADKVIQRSAQIGRNAAVKKAPVRHGYLRDSITVSRVGFLHFKLHTNIEYAVYQEFGTAFFKGNFFMLAGYNAFQADFHPRMKKRMEKILNTNIFEK